ncbi:hypothetical protein [Planococcus dechangensis]|uniref:GlsB/YeaQ/YmgE family stress response membrane protein n=1 Tax=Planococcus dechangensis TaxID=1176255 RepID=A0ABV9MBF8_9BACL
MNEKRMPVVIRGVMGLIAGLIVGGFIGLVVGGTFLGGFDIYDTTGIEGYELAAYVGAVIGAIAGAAFGVKFVSSRRGGDQ